jgi:hypothetical protein
MKYSGPSLIRTLIRIPGWYGQFWAKYSPVFPIEIIIRAHHHHHHHRRRRRRRRRRLQHFH